MVAAEVGEIREPGLPPVLMIDHMVDIAAARPAPAPGEPARAIPHLERPLEVGRHTVGAAIDIDQRAGDRMRE